MNNLNTTPWQAYFILGKLHFVLGNPILNISTILELNYNIMIKVVFFINSLLVLLLIQFIHPFCYKYYLIISSLYLIQCFPKCWSIYSWGCLLMKKFFLWVNLLLSPKIYFRIKVWGMWWPINSLNVILFVKL